MTRYMLSVHTVDGPPREPMTEEQMRETYREIRELDAELRASGAWVLTGRLHPADTATVVRVRDGEVLTTDGPFVEAKEHLGGFYVIDAEDLDAALGWASRVSVAIDRPIEVRPFVDEAGA